MLKLPHHKRYDFLPITKRKHYSWPGGKRLAFYVALNIEHFAFQRGARASIRITARALRRTRNYAWRDYGNRVGNLAASSSCSTSSSCPRSILLNSAVCYEYARRSSRGSKQRGDEVLGHGRTNAEVLRGMWEDDEAPRYSAKCIDVITKHVGVAPTGWMGAGAAETRVHARSP